MVDLQKRKKQKAIVEDRLQNGTLMACGLVAGAALMGVILAIPFVIMGSANALSIMPDGLSCCVVC